MASGARDVTIDIIGRDRTAAATRAAAANFERVKRAQTSLSEGFAKGAVAVAAVAGALAAANKVLKDGITIGLTRANAQVALGSQAFGELEAKADATAHSLGLTSTEFLGAAGQAANLARNLGFNQQEAAKFGGQLPDLANRLSILSSGQISAGEAAETLRSALAGEYDPLQAVGIAISAAAVAQESLNIQKREGGRVTAAQAQALAVAAIVERQTAQATAVMATEEGRRAIKVQESTAALKENIQMLEAQATPALSNAVSGLSKYITFIDRVTGKNAEARRSGESMLDYFNRVADEVVAGKQAQDGLAASTSLVTRATTIGTMSQQQYASALEAARTAAERNSNANLTLREATRQTRDAVEAAKAALRENGRTLNDNTAKGRANAAALDGIAGAANREARAILDAGGSQRQANKALESGRAAFVRLASSAGLSAGKAQALASALFAIPETVTTRVITKYETQGQQPKYRYGNSLVLAQSLGAMWSPIADAGSFRTGGATPITVGAPDVRVTNVVTIPGLDTLIETKVGEQLSRAAWRGRSGRR